MSTFATVVVSILGFIAFFYVNLYAGSYRMRRAASAFLRALIERRYADAHALLTGRFQALIPRDLFEVFLAERGVAEVARFARAHGDFSIGVDRGTVKPILVRRDGVYFPVELTLHREQMSWKVDAIDAQLRLAPAPIPKAANDSDLNRIEVRVSLTFWNAFRSQLRMLFYSRVSTGLSVLLPLGGCYAIYRWVSHGRVPSIPDLLIAIAALLFAPLYAALIVFLVRRNAIAHGPVTYAFDSQGLHIATDLQTESKAWVEVVRVTESMGFLFLFVGARVAHCIPLRTLADAGQLEAVRALLAREVRRGSAAK